MNESTAQAIYNEWVAQFERPHRMPQSNRALRRVHPHSYPPHVPATFRGPKWGTR